MLCVLLCTKSLLSIKKFKVLLFLKMYNGRILYRLMKVEEVLYVKCDFI